MRIFLVCTGDLRRSPVAERLAATWAQQSLADDPACDGVEVVSAGVRATVGRPMDHASARALERFGGDPRDFLSQPLTVELVTGADLVLTMTREQRREVLRLEPRGLRRTFTLPEDADLFRGDELRGLRTLPLQPRARELGRRLDAARA